MNCIVVFLACVIIAEGSDMNIVINEDGIEVDAKKICLPDGNPCYIKCCGLEEIIYYNEDSMTCINNTVDLIDLSPIKDQLTNYSATMSTKKIDETVLYRKNREFRGGINVMKFMEGEEIVNAGNNLKYLIDYEANVTAPKYCYEMIVESSENETNSYYAYLINLDENEETTKILVSAYGCLVSALFIFVTLVVHYLVKKLRQTMYIFLLMQFMASLMVVFLIDSAITIYEYWLVERGREVEKLKVCVWLSPISYFFTLTTFFWMNAMCYEIWRTLKNPVMVKRAKKLSFLAKSLYALYAVGCPAVLTAAAVAIDHSDVPSTISKPDFQSCMRDTEDKLIRMYKYLPMGVIVLSNSVLYCLTIYKVWTTNQMTKGMASTQVNKNKQQLRVYISLSVLMGVTWILECVQVVVEDFPNWLAFILDSFNMLIGVVIFFSTVFKRKIFVELCKRFNIENRWVRESPSTKVQSTKLGHSKGTSGYARTKATDDSIEFESLNVSQDLDKPTPLNPRFVQTKM